MPPAVATPFPPLKRRVTGNMCPMTAAIPSANAPPRPATARPTPLAIAPLPKSATRTTQPGLPAHEPGHVRGPRVPRPLGGDVVTPRSGHEAPRSGTSRGGTPGHQDRTKGDVPFAHGPIQGDAGRGRRKRETGVGYDVALAWRECQRRPSETAPANEDEVEPDAHLRSTPAPSAASISRCTRPSATEPLKRHPGCGGSAPEGVLARRDRPQGVRLLQDRQPLELEVQQSASKSESSESKSESKSETKSERSQTPRRTRRARSRTPSLRPTARPRSRRARPPSSVGRTSAVRPLFPLASPHSAPPERGQPCSVAPRARPALGRRRDRRRGHRGLRRRRPRLAAPPGPGLRPGPPGRRRRP